MSLAKLTARVRQDLTYLDQPAREWAVPLIRQGTRVLDVLIVGAGQGGLAIAFGLKRERITNIRIIDRNPPGLEGPWRRFARMQSLRTRKDVTGLDFGIPSLTMRAYYEARFGGSTWPLIEKIPTGVWQDYLHWYRNVLALPVENETELTAIDDEDGLLQATLQHVDRTEQIICRKIVLATGIEGSGLWRTPPHLVSQIPPARYTHSAAPIDFAALAGQRIAVLGAGPSAFDNAASALEAGAARVDIHFRRAELPRINPLIAMYFSGILAHFADLDDLQRWQLMRHVIEERPPPPPQDVFWRCRRHDNFAYHPGSTWRSVTQKKDALTIKTATIQFEADFIIFATGFDTDLTARPELRSIVQNIALWRDRFTPPDGEASDLLGRHPYLGSAFEFTERIPGTAPYLNRLHNFTHGTLPSLGLTGSAITGIKYGVARLINGLARDLFLEDAEAHCRGLLDYAEPELQTLAVPSDWIDQLATGAIAGPDLDADDDLAALLATAPRRSRLA